MPQWVLWIFFETPRAASGAVCTTMTWFKDTIFQKFKNQKIAECVWYDKRKFLMMCVAIEKQKPDHYEESFKWRDSHDEFNTLLSLQ